MIEKNKFKEELSKNIYSLISLEYVRSKNANAVLSYSLGLMSSLSQSICTIALMYQSTNSEGDKNDIEQFHKLFLDIGVFSYKGEDIANKINEILSVKESLVKEKMEENQDDWYEITYN